ncbi:hypothetical protein, partial [Leptospira brenneri]|uniref:hypothetical protein n=1 Tax=Leptospira brenneri TaxID=2023182 RepID=UPI001AD7EE74
MRITTKSYLLVAVCKAAISVLAHFLANQILVSRNISFPKLFPELCHITLLFLPSILQNKRIELRTFL